MTESLYAIYNDGVDVTMYVSNEDDVWGFKFAPNVAEFRVDVDYVGENLGSDYDYNWITYKDEIMSEHIQYLGGGTVKVNTFDQNVLFKFNDMLDGWEMIYKFGEKNVRLYREVPQCCDGSGCDDCHDVVTKEKFSAYISGNGMNKFGGTGVAVGVYDSREGKRVFFTNRFIDQAYRKYSGNPQAIKVDWNHDGNYIGEVSGLEVKREPVYRLFFRGNAGKPVPSGAGLSIEFGYSKRWNEEFKVFEAVNPVIKAISVLTDVGPGCKICYTK